jgi:hypothetical protein
MDMENGHGDQRSMDMANGQMESEMWDRRHNVGAHHRSGPPRELWSDNDPATTVKGCGFRDESAAAQTIELAGQPGCRYKVFRRPHSV